MIFGIGVDSIEISRFESVKNVEKFASKILSPEEFLEYKASKKPKNFLAKRFAAKEAISKAFGVGIGSRLRFHDITISHDSAGKPIAIIKNDVGFAICGTVPKIHISITDDTTKATVFAIIEV